MHIFDENWLKISYEKMVKECHIETILWDSFLKLLTVFLILMLCQVFGLASSRTEEGGKVQVLTGKVEPGEFIVYLLPKFKRGERLYVYLNTTSGDWDT